MLTQPFTHPLRSGQTPPRVLSRKAQWLQGSQEIAHLSGAITMSPLPFGELLRKRDGEPQSVLEVQESRPLDEMPVIPRPKTKQQPRKSLEQSRIEVFNTERAQENLQRVAGAAGASSMGIARIPQPCEATLDPRVRRRLRELPAMRQRDRSRRKAEQAREAASEGDRHGALASLEKGHVGLRNLKALSELRLSPACNAPCFFEFDSAHNVQNI